MKKTLLSLTAAALLCTALPQQTLAGCFGNSKRSDDIEMTTYGNYASVPAYDGEAPKRSICTKKCCVGTTTSVVATLAITAITLAATKDKWLPKDPKPQNATDLGNANNHDVQSGTGPEIVYQAPQHIPGTKGSDSSVEQMSFHATSEVSQPKKPQAKVEVEEVLNPQAPDHTIQNMGAWERLQNIVRSPFDQSGRLLTAGDIQDYKDLTKEQVVDILAQSNDNPAPGIPMDVRNHTYLVTCINTWNMFQKLAENPAAFEHFQGVNLHQPPQCQINESNFAFIASQGYDFGDIRRYANFGEDTIISGIRAAMDNNLPGMLIQMGQQKIHVACYFVWERLLQRALQESYNRPISERQPTFREHPMVSDVRQYDATRPLSDFVWYDQRTGQFQLNINNRDIENALNAAANQGFLYEDQQGNVLPGFFINIGNDQRLITSPWNFWHTVKQYKWQDGRFVKLQTAPPLVVDEEVEREVASGIQKGEDEYASPKRPQKAKSNPPIKKPTAKKPKNYYDAGTLNTMRTSVQHSQFVSFAYLTGMTQRDANNLFNQLNRNGLSGFWVDRKVDGKKQYLYHSSGPLAKAVWIDSAQHPLLKHLRENYGALPQGYGWY